MTTSEHRIGSDVDAIAGTATVRIRCMGPVSIEVEPGPALDLSPLRPRARAVLKMLAMQPLQFVHRDVIARAHWPHTEVSSCRRSLQVAISGIRRSLRAAGDLTIRRRDDSYALDTSLPVRSDVEDVRATARALISAAPELSTGDVDQALRLQMECRDRLLEGESDAEWLGPVRSDFEMTVVDALHVAADGALTLGRPADAVLLAERAVEWLRHTSAREAPLLTTLVTAHEAAGDRAASRRARRIYATELAGDVACDSEPSIGNH